MKKKKTEEEINNNEDMINEIDKLEGNDEIDESQNLELEEETEDEIDNEEDVIENSSEEFSENTEETIENEENNQKAENKNDKQSETIFSKRVEIPLVGLILVVLIFITIIISLIIFKDKIFNINGLKDENVYSNQLSGDNRLNEEEKIGFDLISKWLEGYKDTSLDITKRIFSYNINSVSLNSKKDNKFIVMATYDIVPASTDTTIWTNDNGEKQGDTIKNKSQYFVIEKMNDKYEITTTSIDKPDINNDELTEEKAILLVKQDFPDSDNLSLSIDSNMIDELDQAKKDEVSSNLGASLDSYYKITGSYRNTYILGTILVNKNTKDKWFVDVDGVVSKMEKATQILNVSDFEVQGDLTMTSDQAILVAISSFPKNKRQGVSIAENWTDSIQNKEQVESKLGNLDEYYALKTSSSNGFILIKKNGLAKEYVSPDGTVTDLVGVEDITTILQ